MSTNPKLQAAGAGRTGLPLGQIDAPTYLALRVEDQRSWYQTKAERFQRQRVVLGVCVTVINAAAAFASWYWTTGADGWVAGFASLSAALTGYASLTGAEYLASSYRSTARQLRRLERDWRRGQKYGGETGFRQFVTDVESVLAREHAGWAKRALDGPQAGPISTAEPGRAPPTIALEEGDTIVPRVGAGGADEFDPTDPPFPGAGG